jgi:hypothetical protein
VFTTGTGALVNRSAVTKAITSAAKKAGIDPGPPDARRSGPGPGHDGRTSRQRPVPRPTRRHDGVSCTRSSNAACNPTGSETTPPPDSPTPSRTGRRTALFGWHLPAPRGRGYTGYRPRVMGRWAWVPVRGSSR